MCRRQGSNEGGGNYRSRDTGRSIASLADGFVGPQVNLLVFDAAPQPLDEHVVPPSAFTVHADGDAVAGERAGEGHAGELRTLVGVEDVGLAVTRHSILQRRNAE